MAVIVSILVGFAAILQGNFNSRMSSEIGLAQAIVIGNIIVLLVSLVFWAVVKLNPTLFSESIQIKTSFLSFKWWYVIPAITGLTIIYGLPFAFSQLGSVKVTIILIASQMLMSIFWDLGVDKIPLDQSKIIGLVFLLLGIGFTLR